MGNLAERRTYTVAKTEELIGSLDKAAALSKGRACVYAIGSFGRVEAGEHSDLDLYIVGKDDRQGRSLLSYLDEVCIKAEFISAIRSLKLPEFDGDGKYLVHYSTTELINTLGKPEDDATNTFTARLLLLLESKALLESGVRKSAIEKIINAYWRDYDDHRQDFIPAFLANDILRLWRTFCVNYEARTQTQPEEKKAKRKNKEL